MIRIANITEVRGIDLAVDGGVRIGDSPRVCVWPCIRICCCLAKNCCSSSVCTSVSLFETVCKRKSMSIRLLIPFQFNSVLLMKEIYLSLWWRCNDIRIKIISLAWVHVLIKNTNFVQIIPAGWSVNIKLNDKMIRIVHSIQKRLQWMSLTWAQHLFRQLMPAFGMVNRRFDALNIYRANHNFYLL